MLSLKPLQIFDLMTFKLSAPLTVHEIFLSSLILIGNGKVDMSFFSPQNSDFNFRILEKKKQKKTCVKVLSHPGHGCLRSLKENDWTSLNFMKIKS